MTAEVFELPVPLVADKPALTANQRLHWAEKARRTAMVRKHVAWRARQQKIPPQEYVIVQLHFRPDVRRDRDPSNLMPTQKPSVDGLVDAGIVPKDTPEWVGELMPVIHEPASGAARMWLAVSVGVSREDRRAIAEDKLFDRTADAASKGDDQ